MQADLFASCPNQDHSWMRYWGKTNRKTGADLRWHLLPYHNLDVAAVACVLLKQHPDLRKRLAQGLSLPEAQLQPFVCTLLALHDIGKYSQRFQNLTHVPGLRDYTGAEDYTVRHDTLGYLLLRCFWFEDDNWRTDLKQRWGLPEKDHEGQSQTMTEDDWWDYLDPILQAITGHHGKPPKAESHHARQHFDERSRTDARAYTQAVFDLFFSRDAGCTRFSEWHHDDAVARAKQASWLLAGLAVVADWIGSNADVDTKTPFFFCFKKEEVSLDVYWDTALKQARHALDQTGIAPVAPSAAAGLGTLFPKLAGYSPTPLQEYARTVALTPEPQLFVLEDATGSGKTEAAALLAHRLLELGCGQGLYFGLPTMATANAMYARFLDGNASAPYRQFFQEPDRVSVVLAHSRRNQSASRGVSMGTDNEDDYQEAHKPDLRGRTYDADEPARAQCTRWLADSRKKALLAHVGIGTIDQALLGVLPSKHQSLRLFGLGTKVLIVDEVHAYDEYVSSLLCTLIRFHAALGGSTILLSATLTRKLRQQFANAFRDGLGCKGVSVEKSDFPLVTCVTATDFQEKPVDPRPDSERSTEVQFFHSTGDVEDYLLEAARKGQCACWIRNTVDDARAAYEQLKDKAEVTLFHARFTLADRLRIEEEVLQCFGPESTQAQRTGRILIATQVVEQSLDLDFDVMVSDLAPIDLLIQRAGRLHRHVRDADGNRSTTEGRNAPTLRVLTPAFASSEAALPTEAEDQKGKQKKAKGNEVDPEDKAAEAWIKAYGTLFRKAGYVYPHVGYLWHSAQILHKRGCIKSPGGIRDLLEAVYEDAPLPAPLEEATNKAFNEMKQARAEAAHHALHLKGGYGGLLAGAQHWYDDHHTPTRLGEPTVTVRLGKLVDGKITPWSDEGWTQSEVSVRLRHLAQEPDWDKLPKPWPDNLRQLVEEAKQEMPDQGKWSLLIVLREHEGQWTGRALARKHTGKDDQDGDKDDKKGKMAIVPVNVAYCPLLGLQTTDKS